MTAAVEHADAAAKAVTTAGVAASLFGLTWWAVAFAVIGAAASYHFEPKKLPAKATRLALGILATAFAAAIVATALPHVPGCKWSGDIDVEIRAGILGLTVRVLYEQGRRLLSSLQLPIRGPR